MSTVLEPTTATMLLMAIPCPAADDSRSASPSSPVRGIRLFRAISRRLSRRDQAVVTSDSRSSSSDSCESHHQKSNNSKDDACSADSGFRSPSSASECAVPDLHRHSASAESVRRVFHNLSLNISNNNNDSKDSKNGSSKNKKKKTPPKRILRSPMTYTYVRGLSGLPTQRVPKGTAGRSFLNGPCGCGMQNLAAFDR